MAVYFLILVGGIVRSTGSGMGCPDWPTCFGSWIPPTSVSQLPVDYKESYVAYRQEKNKKFARYLSVFGFDNTANELLSDPAVQIENDFNVARTWTEYVNRLVGAIIGLLIIGLLLRSLPLYATHPRIVVFSGLTLIAVIFQGWFGSIVVSTNLTHWTITVHMLMAIVMVWLIVYLAHLSNPNSNERNVGVSRGSILLLVVCILAMTLQTLLGTEIRGAIDDLYNSSISRNNWVDRLGLDFIIHRSFSLLVLALHLAFFWKFRKTRELKTSSLGLILIILGAVLTGAGLAYFGVPAFLQPIHLLLATIAFGLQWMMFLRMKIVETAQ